LFLTKVGYSNISSTNTITDLNFHHFAVAKSGSTIQFYVDGVGETTGPYDPGFVFNGPSAIGARGSDFASGFFGDIDEISVYSRALSAAEIEAIYNAGSDGKCAFLTAPVVVVQPTNQTAAVGRTVSFWSTVAGTGPLNYQWLFNRTNLYGATSSTLVLGNVQLSQAGVYALQVTNNYGSVLSSNVTLTVFAPPCAGPISNLISWWKGESNALDQVSGNNGSLVGNATYAADEVGIGFTFNGAGDAVQIGNPPDLQLQNFTIEGWIQRASTTVASQNYPNNGLFFGCTWGGYGVGLWNDGRLLLTKIGYSNISSTNTITDLNFHHFAVAKSGSTIQFYVDGVGETTGPYDPGFVFNGPSAIGARGSDFAGGFFGDIDEISVYSRALSAAEIQSIYNAAGSGKCLTPIPPFLISQPDSQSIPAGANLTLNALAAGSSPLSYQWQYNSTNLVNATNSSLALTNVAVDQSGIYAVLVTNLAGSILSTNALVTVIPPPASVQVASTDSASGAIATLPIVITANGNENALAFSIVFDQASLTYTGAVAGVTGANLTPNISLLSSGKLGLIFSLPPGATLNPGTQQVALVSFATPVVTINAKVVSVSFGDQPTPRQLLDGQLNTLPASYTSGNLTMNPATAFEGDLFPRPNGELGLGLDDWLQTGRFVARLDYPTNGSEFQRADCAPRAALGDGVINVADWVQVGRYVAGLDPMTPAGGPTNELSLPGPGT